MNTVEKTLSKMFFKYYFIPIRLDYGSNPTPGYHSNSLSLSLLKKKVIAIESVIRGNCMDLNVNNYSSFKSNKLL